MFPSPFSSCLSSVEQEEQWRSTRRSLRRMENQRVESPVQKEEREEEEIVPAVNLTHWEELHRSCQAAPRSVVFRESMQLSDWLERNGGVAPIAVLSLQLRSPVAHSIPTPTPRGRKTVAQDTASHGAGVGDFAGQGGHSNTQRGLCTAPRPLRFFPFGDALYS